ncbi:ABC transporter ATP-binding protein [Longibacter salinarum]|uniref:ABC transporter ATP-binding protein n=1 Tax=Longibacter salinarum TaxID=1850348 RepID=UPI0015CEF767|nr:ABC transporter ATP-binding protein [Longibacter salinarum]
MLDNCDLEIRGGMCLCVLGRNGAGKSTLIHLLADLIAPDSGGVRIDELSYADHSVEIKSRLGVFPEQNPAIPELTGDEYLEFVGRLHGLPEADRVERSASLIKFFFDGAYPTDTRIKNYSAGMRQKIGLIGALLHKPSHLILDEPFASLDPPSAMQLVNLLNDYRSSQRTMLISSHDLAYAEQVATHVTLLEGGHLSEPQPIESLAEGTAGQRLLEFFGDNHESVPEWLTQA